MSSRLTIVSLSIASLIIQACSHPIEIVGQGDVTSASGTRKCSLEDFQTAQTKCTKNYAVGAYQETYYARPRDGWRFDHWGNYCTNATNNECSFNFPQAVVVKLWGQTMPSLQAVFTESPVSFIDLQYLKPSANQNSHSDYFPVAGSPILNEQIKVVATLSGQINIVTFEFRTLSGNVIGPAALARWGESVNSPFDYGGDVRIPIQPFLFAAVGETQDGENFDVILPGPIIPEHIRVYFSPSVVTLQPGGAAEVTLFVENGSEADTFNITFSDLAGLLQTPAATTFEVDAGATATMQLDIVAPQTAPLINPVPVVVNTTTDSNPDRQTRAELLVRLESAL